MRDRTHSSKLKFLKQLTLSFKDDDNYNQLNARQINICTKYLRPILKLRY